MQAYSDPRRESDPYVLPDVETFKAYEHECLICEAVQPLCVDYHGLLYADETPCVECGGVKCLRVTDTKIKWYWRCLPDGDPIGPFETEALALADAQSNND